MKLNIDGIETFLIIVLSLISIGSLGLNWIMYNSLTTDIGIVEDEINHVDNKFESWVDSYNRYDMYSDAYDQPPRYNQQVAYDQKLEGVYFRNSYYCVWTRDKTAEEISTTKDHELCHALVYLNPTHFCKNY